MVTDDYAEKGVVESTRTMFSLYHLRPTVLINDLNSGQCFRTAIINIRMLHAKAISITMSEYDKKKRLFFSFEHVTVTHPEISFLRALINATACSRCQIPKQGRARKAGERLGRYGTSREGYFLCTRPIS